ncbi:MAG: hypothetical protein CMQ39_06030 [Gammaproteobacteria bacterium]|nr:hypothetical protein [Gammaproteobacteria bacterium]
MPLIKTPRLEMFVEERGVGSPVLFVSGTGADLRVKPNVLDSPLAKSFRVIAYDQRGLGQTQKPLGPYEMEDYSIDAIALLDKLGIDNVYLVGVSFGGMVALHVALQYPERVTKIVLCCTSPGGVFASFPFHDLPDDQTATERAMQLMEFNDLRHTRRWQRDNATSVDAMIKVMNSRLIKDHATLEFKRGYREQIQARSRHDVVANLDRIKSETFICAGLYDGIAPEENQRVMLEKIPNSRCQFYSGGHLFLFEDQKAWGDIIEFLAN